jgi:Mg-chelatase subunit ChlD
MTLGASSIFFGVVVATGCGSSSDSTFKNGGSSNANTDSANAFGDPNDPGGVDPNLANVVPGAGDVGNVDPTAACATSSDGAVLPPIELVFMIDRSGSMKSEHKQSTIDVRWNPVKGGLTTFFGDAKSSNISASLAFFPIGGDNPTCDSNQYKTAVVPMTQLPNAGAFSTAFTQGPAGSTPTEPALQGAIDAAKAAKAVSGKTTAVVLATDGQPNGCNSDPDGVSAIAAAGFKDGIKTYVIGVGPSTGNLNDFAAGGGTGQAIMIPTNNTAQVSADLIAAFGQIATSLLGCTYGLPTPPNGKTLDVNAVNVNYTAPGGKTATLAYSADCANPNGWHYDSTSAPKEVILCNNACTTAQAQAGAKLDIVFGCATAVQPGSVDPSGTIH